MWIGKHTTCDILTKRDFYQIFPTRRALRDIIWYSSIHSPWNKLHQGIRRDKEDGHCHLGYMNWIKISKWPLNSYLWLRITGEDTVVEKVNMVKITVYQEPSFRGFVASLPVHLLVSSAQFKCRIAAMTKPVKMHCVTDITWVYMSRKNGKKCVETFHAGTLGTQWIFLVQSDFKILYQS